MQTKLLLGLRLTVALFELDRAKHCWMMTPKFLDNAQQECVPVYVFAIHNSMITVLEMEGTTLESGINIAP